MAQIRTASPVRSCRAHLDGAGRLAAGLDGCRRSVRVVPGPVEPSVDGLLHLVPHRVEQRRPSQRYFVHPSEKFVPPIDSAEVLHTSAAWFIKLLDDALVSAGCLLPTAMYDRLEIMDQKLRRGRAKFDSKLPPWRFPLAIYNHSYQDGMADALERARAKQRSGSDRRHGDLIQRAKNYFDFTTAARRKRNYWDAAYYEGYGNGLFTLGVDEVPLEEVPVFYCPGIDETTSFDEVSDAVRGGEKTHKTAHRWAVKQDIPKGMYWTHGPFL